MNQEAREALERLETIGICYGAVTDLLIPDADVCAVMRGDLAVLMDFLHYEQEQAQMKLARALNTA